MIGWYMVDTKTQTCYLFASTDIVEIDSEKLKK